MGRRREEKGWWGGESEGKTSWPISEDKSSEVGQLSGRVNFQMLNVLGTITFC